LLEADAFFARIVAVGHRGAIFLPHSAEGDCRQRFSAILTGLDADLSSSQYPLFMGFSGMCHAGSIGAFPFMCDRAAGSEFSSGECYSTSIPWQVAVTVRNEPPGEALPRKQFN
jgi:hypothetical protein